MVQVTELVSQMHETLSDIRSTISSLTSPEHESLLDNAEKHRDTAVTSLKSEFAVETTSLAQKRAAEISAIEEQRRREDEAREARRRQEDEARKANAEAEDKARQRALAEKTSELEEQTEAEMTRIEAEADRKLDEGQARLVALEQRRKELNRQIDEQMSLPLPIVPLRRKTREQTQKSAPEAISAKEVLGEKHAGDDHAVLSASATEATTPEEEPAPAEPPQEPATDIRGIRDIRGIVTDRKLSNEILVPLVDAITITPSDTATHEEENAAAETVPEEKPAQVHSPEPVVPVEAAEETTATDELPEDDQKLTEELDTPETEAEVDEEEHEEREAKIFSVPSVVGADEEAAHQHPEETPAPRILAEAPDLAPGSIPSIEFIPPTPAPENTTHVLPEARPTKDQAMETNAVVDAVESALVAPDESHQPEGEATRDTEVSDVAPVVAALPAVEVVLEQTIEETHAAEGLVAVSETMPTQIETPIEILSIPALPSFEPKMEADVKSTISTKEEEEPVLMYLPSTCYCPEPPVFVFPSPPPAPVSNEPSDGPLEHGVQVQEEISHGEEARELPQDGNVREPGEFHEPRPNRTTELADATPVRQFFEQQTVQDSSSAWHYQAPCGALDVYAYAAPPPVDECSYFTSPQSLEPSPCLHKASSYQEPAENAVTVHGQDDLFDVSNDNESDGSVLSELVDSPREDQFEYDNISIDASGTVVVQQRSPAIAEADVPETPTTIVGDAQSHEARAAEQAIHVARPVTPPQLYDGNDDDPSFDDDFMPRDVTHISWGEHNVYTTPGSVRSEATVSEASSSATPCNSGLDLHHSEPVIRSSWADTPPDIVMNGRNKALGQLDYALSLDTTTPTNTPPTAAILQQQQQQPKSRPSSIAAVSPSVLFQRMRSIFEPANGASAVSDGHSWTTTTPTDTPPQNRHLDAGVPLSVTLGQSFTNASATVDDPERRHNDYHHHYHDADGDDCFSEQTSLLQAAAPISPSY